ncbi:DUF6480 family protein [Streptomyces bambusae]|uniref:DUF6480 family protein n=1 Tax=Streptomyces bambusae TaxID=1550616 RepID=UPI001CFE2F13|nr:DUF6480 family protein [Streptomyces bambusae]MCB5164539.1 DUF6480 family protein [Streptomyces bambusae]
MNTPGTPPTPRTPPAGPTPEETPPAEGSISSAHPERPDGGVWEHPRAFLVLIAIGAAMIAAFFAARIAGA